MLVHTFTHQIGQPWGPVVCLNWPNTWDRLQSPLLHIRVPQASQYTEFESQWAAKQELFPPPTISTMTASKQGFFCGHKHLTFPERSSRNVFYWAHQADLHLLYSPLKIQQDASPTKWWPQLKEELCLGEPHSKSWNTSGAVWWTSLPISFPIGFFLRYSP